MVVTRRLSVVVKRTLLANSPRRRCAGRAAVRLRERKGKDGAPARLDVLAARLTTEAPSREVQREFSGSLNRIADKDFAFIGDLFVPPPVVQVSGCADGEQVRATAIWAYSAKKKQSAWLTVTLEKDPI